MMLISMILDPEACISDAGFFRVGRTDERTNEQADSRSWIGAVCLANSLPLLSCFFCPGLAGSVGSSLLYIFYEIAIFYDNKILGF